ncbi:MAG: DNA primase [Rhodothalassiaceae bacterium]
MRFPPRFLDELRDRAALGDLVGRKVKLVRAGRELKGLCPFHNERTPSFHIVEDKGFYHCFGCGAHGDAIDWLMEAEGASFPEAVERLAELTGLPLPKPDPETERRSAERADLHAVLDLAARWFARQLGGEAGKAARDYLKGRGVDTATVRSFRLGYAPGGDGAALRAFLAGEDIDEAALIATGLFRRDAEGNRLYPVFRDRIIFPIADRKDRIIGFGGRAMDPEAKAKYLNSPEGPLFDKGRSLYNIGPARRAAREGATVLLVEGYLDVIALHQAGFAAAVAPLGTALTEDQMRELWRIAPEPVLCFDGDKAGLRAAERAIERALPLLMPGQSLRFATLPDGSDPDDLIRREGRAAMARVIDAAEPLADRLWHMTIAGADLGTPERRAAAEKLLRGRIDMIQDERVRRFYHRDAGERLFQAFRPARQTNRARPGPERTYGRVGTESPSPALKASRLAGIEGGNDRIFYERALCLYLLNHPVLAEERLEEVAAPRFADERLDKLRQEILVTLSSGQSLDRTALRNHLMACGLSEDIERLETTPSVRPLRSAWPEATANEAGIGFLQVLARLRRLMIEEEIDGLARSYGETGDDGALRRLIELKKLLQTGEGNEAEIEGSMFRS